MVSGAGSDPGRQGSATRLRTRVGVLLLYALSSSALACARPSGDDAPGGALATRVEESSRYGEDRVTGLLHVTGTEAYLDSGRRRIRLVGAAPMTATGLEALLAHTADALRRLAGERVRARGDLQGDVLWSAQVMHLE